MRHDLTDYIPWDDVIFIDCETRSAPDQDNPLWEDVTKTSTARYADNAWPIIITWAHGLEGEVKRWESKDITKPTERDDLPAELHAWDGYWAAWNSGFDRKILDPYLHGGILAWLDMMAHAAYNNMPLGLDRAAKTCGQGGKIASGKTLIKMFCSPYGDTPETQPEKWKEFCEYADVDVIEMQRVAQATMPVPVTLWREFWVSEAINDRGIPFDRPMAEGGAKIAEAYAEQVGERMDQITDGYITSARQYIRQRQWVWDRVKHIPTARAIMVEAERVNPETGEEEVILKMDRPRITKLLAYFEQLNEEEGLSDEEDAVMQLLTEREYGASAAPAKFSKMLAMADSRDRLTGQYVFSGATQTGRFSARGIQVHNMTNRPIGSAELEEEAAFYMIDQQPMENFAETFGNVGRALSLMVRPTICAETDKELVWGDWSNIEARGLPWLAKAEHRLDVFRAIDADPNNTPDVYLQAAAGMYGHDPMDLLEGHKEGTKEVKALRQKGKIAELALGFSGGAGALQSMAANYGMAFGDDEAQDIVDRWRKANPWALEFWNECMHAFKSAFSKPNTRFHAGRVSYEAYEVGGSGGQIWVVCYLPDGRPLFYRNVRMRKSREIDPFTKEVLKEEMKLSFDGEAGVKYVWRGILVENITQAICASVLRDTLEYLESNVYTSEIVAHTHDEIVMMCAYEEVDATKRHLEEAMLRDHYGWHNGFPLGVDILSNKWYSKAIE